MHDAQHTEERDANDDASHDAVPRVLLWSQCIRCVQKCYDDADEEGCFERFAQRDKSNSEHRAEEKEDTSAKSPVNIVSSVGVRFDECNSSSSPPLFPLIFYILSSPLRHLQFDSHCRPFSFHAIDVDRTTRTLYDSFDDVETEAIAIGFVLCRVRSTSELPEDAWQIVLRDAMTMILDFELGIGTGFS